MFTISDIFRMLIGTVMVIAVLGKGIALEEFEIELKTLLIPFISEFTEKPSETQAIIKAVEPFLLPLALLILLMESLIGLFLLFKIQVKVCARALVLLLMVFILVLVVNLLNPSPELKTCGCFGSLWEEPLSWWSVIRNGVLAVLAWAVYRAEAERET